MPTDSQADIQAKLEASRKDLLDLTFRNPLLNYRPLTARGVEIVEAEADAVYSALVGHGKKLSFAAREVPRAESPEAEETRVEAPQASEVREATGSFYSTYSQDLSETAGRTIDDFFSKLDAQEEAEGGPAAPQRDAPFTPTEPAVTDASETAAAKSGDQSITSTAARAPQQKRDNALQTAYAPAELLKRLLNTQYTARSFIEEQGVNTLFLALGMLRWREPGADASGVGPKGGVHRSPLILIPVEIERAAASDRFTVRYAEEEITENVSLAKYLYDHFQLELPALPEREDLDVVTYLEQVRLIIGGRDGWEIEGSAIVLAFFSFNKYLMYKELEDTAWPANQGPSGHPILAALLGSEGFHEPDARIGEDDFLDDVLPATASKTVVEADSSQLLAIEDVKQGRNLVIQGPPGTGKSQSITNIIAEALGQGKTILFVSEKMAALEVVKRRLDSVGLGDACLELHSNKTNKKSVRGELQRTLGLDKPIPNHDAGDDLQLLIGSRDRLNAYCDTVNDPIGASGITPHRLFGEWLHLQAAHADADLPRLDLPAVCVQWTSLDYRNREQKVSELQAHIQAMGGVPAEHPFWGSQLTAYSSVEAERFRSAFHEALEATARLREAAASLSEKLSLAAPATFSASQSLAAAVERAVRAPQHEGMQFRSGQWLARRADLEELITLGAHMVEVKARHAAVLIPEAWDRDVLATRQAISEHGAKWFKFALGDWRSAQKELRMLCCAGTAPAPDVSSQLELLDAILEYRRTKGRFTEQSALGATLFGAQWQGERSDWAVLSQLLEWIVGVHREVGDGSLPKAFVDFLSGGLDLTPLAPEAASVIAAVEKYLGRVEQACTLIDLRDAGALRSESFTVQEAKFSSWVANIGRLQQMSAFNHLASACRALDLASVVEAAGVSSRGGDRLVPALRHAYCQALMRQVFAEHPEIANFSGAVHERIAAQFREADIRLLENNRVALASRHWEAISRLNASLGLGGGEVRILTREFEKKSRLLPIRQLLEKSGHAIQAIKPVFMMSPLSVATFLSPGHLKFDLVVFDEASQVKPVDALGALARGAQAVVVGDSKQLPPTSFFDSIAQADAGLIDEDNQTSDMESVLGLFVGQGAPQRMLTWHYRSRHESLIAVSNQEFYEGKLVVFPSPDAARERSGLTYRYMPDTVYDRGGNGTNRLEAKAVAEAAMAHAHEHLTRPVSERQTLGIAAFSMGQMESIREEIELLRRANPDCEPFFSAADHEPFFVKNLENVQGDERDVIFISVGYGRDKTGAVSMNFGPLNKIGGERRLNVLISRARQRCIVFTNLLPDDIDLARTDARGVEAFKTFLAYARSAETALGETTAGTRPSAATGFEQEVLKVLQGAGHGVVPQVGCAGYFVDLAIIDPERPGSYILGIECDGPNYRSARSARDRDRLRSEVLTKMGWRLHRIWSPDWVHRYDDEVAKLNCAVADAQAEARAADLIADAPVDAPAFVVPVIPETNTPPPDPHNSPAVDPSIPRLEAELDPGDAALPPVAVPYRIAEPSTCGSGISGGHSAAATAAVAALVAEVVAAESPIHWHELARRIAGAIGVGRVTESFQVKVHAAAEAAERDRRVRIDGKFLWAPQMREPSLRDRSALDARSRNIDYIASEEIALAVLRVVSTAYGIGLDDLARATARLLGFKQVTNETKERVDSVIQAMIQTGQLLYENDAVCAVNL